MSKEEITEVKSAFTCYMLTRFSVAGGGLSVVLFYLLSLTVLRGSTGESGLLIAISYIMIGLLGYLAIQAFLYHDTLHKNSRLSY